MGIYDRQIATAKRLIKAKGQLVIWRQPIDGARSKPWIANSASSADYNVSIAFFPYGTFTRETIKANRNTDVPTVMLYGLMPAVEFIPKIRDIVITPTDTYNVVSIDPLAPNGDIIYYQIGFEA